MPMLGKSHHIKGDYRPSPAKRPHRIVKDFYVTERTKENLPKIFGMTASPVDAKVDPVRAAE